MLLNEIIEMLGDEKGNLSGALLKTKIFLYQIGKKELAEWVNYELNGYPDKATIPDYRILPSDVRGNAASTAWQFSDHPLPTIHMNDFFKENFLKSKMHQSLSTLEDMCSDAKSGGSLRRYVPLEYNGKLGEVLVNGVNISSAWCTTQIHDVKGILTQVRSRLLDFLLDLKGNLGDVMSDDDVKKEAAKVDASNLFNNAVFGHNTTIMLSSNNIQSAQNKIEVGDLAALVNILIQSGISKDDIEELKIAISEDEEAGGKASFDGKTGGWFTRMIGKAAKGGLKLTTEVASNVISSAISSYIGLPNN